MKYLILVSALTFGVMSCSEDSIDTAALPSSKQLDFGDFTIEVPATWQAVDMQGIDSNIGGIQMDEGQQATFDLGRYSNSLDVALTTHTVTMIRVDNKEAKQVTPMTPGRGTTGVYIPNLNDGGIIRFELHGEDLTADNQQALIDAIETIDFK